MGHSILYYIHCIALLYRLASPTGLPHAFFVDAKTDMLFSKKGSIATYIYIGKDLNNKKKYIYMIHINVVYAYTYICIHIFVPI